MSVVLMVYLSSGLLVYRSRSSFQEVKVSTPELPDGFQNPQVAAKMAHRPPNLEPRCPPDIQI
eukprot:5073649-Karenia_brevis.AAC.1